MPAKTDEETREAIVRLRRQDHTYREIERELGVSQPVIANTLHENGMTDSKCDDPHCTTCNEGVLEDTHDQAFKEGFNEGYEVARYEARRGSHLEQIDCRTCGDRFPWPPERWDPPSFCPFCGTEGKVSI